MHDDDQNLAHSDEEQDAEGDFLEDTIGPVVKVLMREERKDDAFKHNRQIEHTHDVGNLGLVETGPHLDKGGLSLAGFLP